MKVLLFVSLLVCLVDLGVLANHWWGGEYGYKVKVHHPVIHGGWGWNHWVGPSSGWTTMYDTHKKNPKGWWGGWEDDHHHHKKHHKKHHKHWW